MNELDHEIFKLYRPVDIKRLVSLYNESANPAERSMVRSHFRINNQFEGTQGGDIKFSTSLFLQNHDFQNPSLNPNFFRLIPFHDPEGCDRMLNDHGWVKKGRSWWNTYLKPLIEFDNETIDLHVYICPYLFDAIRSLLPQRHTYHIMENPSIRHNPGSLWRFLGLTSSKTVFNVDADALPYSIEHLPRWIDSKRTWFRRAHCCSQEVNEFDDNSVFYHPMTASEFGCRAFSIRQGEMFEWLCAFWWAAHHSLLQTSVWYPPLNKMCNLFGRHPHGYGFDEIFLMQVIYPMAFKDGMFSIFPPDDRMTYLSRLDFKACKSMEGSTHTIEVH